MKTVALIPARGGSKGIPRKNIKDLGGRPLIAWTIDCALASGIDRVVVSTDDDEIASIAKEHGAEVPFMRPAEFSGDLAPAMAVLRHAVETLSLDGWDADVVAYLQPTSPFRRAASLADALKQFARSDAPTLVSVQRVPHNMTPDAQMSIEDGVLVFPNGAAGPLRRQEKPERYARNGPAILILSRQACFAERLYEGRVLPFLMGALESFDIDEPEDWDWAECLLPLAKRV